MSDQANDSSTAGIAQELDDALATLDTALLQAGRSVAIIRRNLPQFAALDRVVREMEEAMARARQQLNTSWDSAEEKTPLRPVPRPETEVAESPESTQNSLDSHADESDGKAADDLEPAAAQQSGLSAARCLRLTVASKIGSLDLKAVDGSVNENPSVLDVALLDYDGRQATLKLWVNDSADPEGVREALVSSLRNHLGDANQIDLNVDFEPGSAA